MADNITAPGAGSVLATDDVGGVHFPYAKAVMTSGGNLTATTQATGTNWTTLSAQACSQLTIGNNSGATIEFRQGGSGAGFPVFDKSSFTIFGIANANEISVRRVDTSNTQVTVAARWEA